MSWIVHVLKKNYEIEKIFLKFLKYFVFWLPVVEVWIFPIPTLSQDAGQ